MINSNIIENQNNKDLTSNKTSFREDLKSLVKRFYTLMGYNIIEKENILEINENNSKFPLFKYTFDKKSSLKNPEANLITFNSSTLNNIIDTIREKGRFAKGFLPFKFEPKATFSSSIEKLILKSKNEINKYIINGEIESLGHYITYIPFLVLILKITFVSLETTTIIEKPVIALNRSKNEIKFNEAFYAQKIKSFFSSEKPDLSSKMPIEGDLIDLEESDFKEIIKKTIQEIELSVVAQIELMKGKIDQRLQKEINILDNYYDQRIFEIQNQIVSANEKNKKEDLKKFNQDLLSINEERKFKKTEYEKIYQLRTEYEIIGSAMIYAPANFYFKTRISTPFGNVEKDLEYDIFDNEIIPPKCSCGELIYQGAICQDLHLTCVNCFYTCKECGRKICKTCEMHNCKICNSALCKEHFYECNHCKESKFENRWICNDHLNYCDNCQTSLCPDCSISCVSCEKLLCKFDTNCSFKCPICNNYSCLNDSFICSFDNKKYCLNELKKCDSCNQNYCEKHFFSRGMCKTCKESSNLIFYKFLKNKNVEINLPTIFKNPNDNSIVKVNIGRHTYNVPKNLLKLKMNENKNFYIFILKNFTNRYTIIHNKITNEEILFNKSQIIGKILDLINKNKTPKEVRINNPFLIFKTKKTKKKSNVNTNPICKKCNKTFSEDYKICPYCGQKLET